MREQLAHDLTQTQVMRVIAAEGIEGDGRSLEPLEREDGARHLVHVEHVTRGVEHDEPVVDALDHRLGLRLLVEHGVDVQLLERFQALRHLPVLVCHLLELRERLRPERRVGAPRADRAEAARELGERPRDGAGERPAGAGDHEGQERQRREHAEDEAVRERARATVGREHRVLVERDEAMEIAVELGCGAVETVGRRGRRVREERARLRVDPPGELRLAGLGVVAVLDRQPALERGPQLGARARTAAVVYREAQIAEDLRHALRRLDAPVVARKDLGDGRLEHAQMGDREEGGGAERHRQADRQKPEPATK